MSDHKIIHQLTDEELLQIAQGAKADKVIEKVSEAAKFIYGMSIREGYEPISAMMVYHTYKQYKGWNNKCQSKRYFYRDFNKYFTPHRNRDGLYYLLDPRSFDLSPENYFIMRKDHRDGKAKRKKASKRSG